MNPNWRTGDCVRWEGSLARSGDTSTTASMQRSESHTGFIGCAWSISARPKGAELPVWLGQGVLIVLSGAAECFGICGAIAEPKS
jgi:hypothetical protein